MRLDAALSRAGGSGSSGGPQQGGGPPDVAPASAPAAAPPQPAAHARCGLRHDYRWQLLPPRPTSLRQQNSRAPCRVLVLRLMNPTNLLRGTSINTVQCQTSRAMCTKVRAVSLTISDSTLSLNTLITVDIRLPPGQRSSAAGSARRRARGSARSDAGPLRGSGMHGSCAWLCKGLGTARRHVTAPHVVPAAKPQRCFQRLWPVPGLRLHRPPPAHMPEEMQQ
jgi:hypothetical protein